ncbi:MAG: pitrilysin family protein [Armatimonadota bacterium]|nr:pitrilysin family protein [Armatimonadota bacterium]MDR7427004.1 pitrilysin family protein [Armatimonadota bacterium]MDR7463078.1 pitrilysin family protein [Armatimonadota bacterium]MDR7469339.1 pitrilysin family protein [Armatimonadota bacterium]MDR7475602.1 pitrilysin family protein [Armatimonadota bacterium]
MPRHGGRASRPGLSRRLASLLTLTALAIPVLTAGGAPVAAAQAPPQGAAPLSRHVLPSGLVVLIRENRTADLVAVDVLVRAAPRVEEADEGGAAFFVREVLFRGTARRSAADIATGLEAVGGSLSALTSFDYTELAAVAPTAATDAALDLLADLVTDARFDPADVEAQRRISLARLRARADQPAARAFDLALAALYPLHPYGKGLLGSAETVSALSRDRLTAFYRTFYTAPNMVVSLAGNLPAEVALRKVEQAFARLRRQPPPHRVRLLRVVEGALAPRPAQRREVREVRQTAQASIVVAYLGVPAGHRDWAALRALSAILGEGLSSRLFVEIREKRGLAYAVGSSFSTLAGPAPILLSAGTDPANETRVVEALLGEAARLGEAAAAPGEMDRARQRIIGVHAIDHEDLRRQAFLPGFYELLGVGYAFDGRIPDLVSRVRAEDVQRAARLYLQHPVVAVVAPPAR